MKHLVTDIFSFNFSEKKRKMNKLGRMPNKSRGKEAEKRSKKNVNGPWDVVIWDQRIGLNTFLLSKSRCICCALGQLSSIPSQKKKNLIPMYIYFNNF